LTALDWSAIGDGIKSALSGAWSSVVSWFGDVKTKFGSIKDTITSAFSGAAHWLVDPGRDIVQGLMNGAGGLLSSLGRWFLDHIPGWIVEPFKAALGIHSPSTVFAELGKNTTAGYVQGLESSAKGVSSAVTGLVTMPSAGPGTAAAAAAAPRTV